MTGAAIGERVRLRIHEKFGKNAKQQDVAAAVGMTPDAFSRSLSGSRNFAALELARLSTYLGTSMHWLVTGEEDPNAVLVAARHTFDHHARQHDSVDWDAERTGIETISTAYMQVFGKDSVSLDLPALPSMAAEARDRLARVTPHYVRDFAEAVEIAFGIDVVRVPEADRSYSMSVAGHRVIVVQPHVNWFFQNWSIAHELGHFATAELEPLMGAGKATDAAEKAANAFAAELLLPASELHGLDWQTMSTAELADLLWSWGVSTEAVRRRLATLQIVPSNDIRELLQLSTQKVLRRHRRDDATIWFDPVTDRMERANTRRFPASLLAAHSEAVMTGRLRANYLAWMLGADVRDLEGELAPVADTARLDELARALGLGPAK